MHTETAYDDDYPSCAKTFSWFRVMSQNLDPDEVSRLLGVSPTKTQRRGDPSYPGSEKLLANGGWFLETEEHVESNDARRHLDWLLARLVGKATEIDVLKRQGHLVDLCVRWDSYGEGGPTLSPAQLTRLGELGIEMWFDIYFVRDDVGDVEAEGPLATD